MHHFLRFILEMKLYMFRTIPYFQNKFKELLQRLGFIIRKFITIHGHINVKLVVISYRGRFGITYRPYLQVSRIQLFCFSKYSCEWADLLLHKMNGYAVRNRNTTAHCCVHLARKTALPYAWLSLTSVDIYVIARTQIAETATLETSGIPPAGS
jgi:hypothetical protein